MSLLKRFLLMMMAGLLLLLLLSRLPVSSWEKGGTLLPVYRIDRGTEERELVHFLIQQHFLERIKWVQLAGGRLMIDFTSESLPEKKSVMEDLSRLIDRGFATLPLEEIWVRSLARWEKDEEVIVGVIAKRDQYRRGLWNEKMDEKAMLNTLKNRYQLTFGLLWTRYGKE